MYASILLPVRDGGAYLRQALDSVITAAGDQPYELLIQDGMSTDDTERIAAAHSASIRYVRTPDDGQTDALNRALDRSSGDLIGWLNADDIYLPKAIQVAAEAFEAHPAVDIVFGSYYVIDAQSAILRHHRPGSWDWNRLYTSGNYIFTGATFFRRSVFDRSGHFDARYEYVADFEFFLRIGAQVRALNVGQGLGAFRYHQMSKSGAQRFRFCAEAASVRRQYRAPGLPGLLSYGRAQSILWLAAAVAPVRYTRAYSRARRASRHLFDFRA